MPEIHLNCKKLAVFIATQVALKLPAAGRTKSRVCEFASYPVVTLQVSEFLSLANCRPLKLANSETHNLYGLHHEVQQ
jgi:hypothetical protein